MSRIASRRFAAVAPTLALASLSTGAAADQASPNSAPPMIAAPAIVDPATVAPGSKAIARRITMVVSDLDRSIRFYEGLGFKADRRVEVTDPESLEVFGLPNGTQLTFARLVSDNTLSTGRIDGGTLGLAQVRNRDLVRLRERTRGETMIGTHILVMTTDGVDAVYARLQKLGLETLKPPKMSPAGWSTLIARDPDGTRMEITQPPPSVMPQR